MKLIFLYNLVIEMLVRVEKAALKFYGECHFFRQGGYITPSGYLLDFSEGSGSRVQDHRNIGYVLDTLDIDLGEYAEINGNTAHHGGCTQ